jgi:hypothetical protein
VGGGTRRTQLFVPHAFEKSFKKSARTFFSFFIFLFFPLFSMGSTQPLINFIVIVNKMRNTKPQTTNIASGGLETPI